MKSQEIFSSVAEPEIQEISSCPIEQENQEACSSVAEIESQPVVSLVEDVKEAAYINSTESKEVSSTDVEVYDNVDIKFNHNPTIDEDFKDNRVIVTLKHAYSTINSEDKK